MKVNLGKFHKKSDSRRVNVTIEKFDIWSLDHTLALIILPALLHLKEVKNGVPNEFADVGGEDYHDQLCFDFYSDSQLSAFQIGMERWDAVLDKMIWSFQQIVYGDGEEQYYYGRPEFNWNKVNKTFQNPLTNKTEDTYEMEDTNPTDHWTDFVGMRKHEERVQEGLELFGRYFRSLWD